MKAVILVGDGDLRFDEMPEPAVGPGLVKVRVRACGICGSDVPRVLHHGAHFYPIVLGHEFAGDVVEIGDGVTQVKVGDRVSCAPLVPCRTCADCQRGNFSLCRHYSFIGSREQGGMAEYVVLPEANAVRYGGSVSYETAAMFEPATVALHGILLNGGISGLDVAVVGCGTIGIFAIQWAKLLGARSIAAFDIAQDRLDFARRMGADQAFDTREADFDAKARVRTLNGAGFDAVFDVSGCEATIHAAFRLAANRARVCIIGTPVRDVAFSKQMWELMNRKEFRLTGSWMSYSAPFPGREWQMVADYASSGKFVFDPQLVFRTYPLTQAKEAFDLFRNPSQVHGKVMLRCDATGGDAR